jgi:hypothetical protein
MQQAREARDQAQVEARVEAAVAEAEEVEDKGEEVVSVQARAVIAFAPTVVKKHPINWGAPVMSRNAPSAERP